MCIQFSQNSTQAPFNSTGLRKKARYSSPKLVDQTSASAFPIQVGIPKQKNTQKEMNWVFAGDHDLIEID